MNNAERMKQLRAEREAMEPEVRKIKALEQIADLLMSMKSDIVDLKVQVTNIAASKNNKS